MKLEKSFIPSVEPGARLEIVTARPLGEGPHPAVVFNHGSTGRGQNKSLYSRAVAPASWQTTSWSGDGWHCSLNGGEGENLAGYTVKVLLQTDLAIPATLILRSRASSEPLRISMP